MQRDKTTSVSGFLLLRSLASRRPLRPLTSRGRKSRADRQWLTPSRRGEAPFGPRARNRLCARADQGYGERTARQVQFPADPRNPGRGEVINDPEARAKAIRSALRKRVGRSGRTQAEQSPKRKASRRCLPAPETDEVHGRRSRRGARQPFDAPRRPERSDGPPYARRCPRSPREFILSEVEGSNDQTDMERQFTKRSIRLSSGEARPRRRGPRVTKRLLQSGVSYGGGLPGRAGVAPARRDGPARTT